MRRKKAPQILGAAARVGQHAIARFKEVSSSRGSRRKMAMRLNARWRSSTALPGVMLKNRITGFAASNYGRN